MLVGDFCSLIGNEIVGETQKLRLSAFERIRPIGAG